MVAFSQPVVANGTPYHLPGYLRDPKYMIHIVKGKEVNSGVNHWEMTKDGDFLGAVDKDSKPIGGSFIFSLSDIHPESFKNLPWAKVVGYGGGGERATLSHYATAPNVEMRALVTPTTNNVKPPPAMTIEFFRREFERAQRIYPAAFCVFVANLPAHLSDVTLTISVLSLFSAYGPVYGCVQRNGMGGKNKPYCLLQYTNGPDTELALMQLASYSPSPHGHQIGNRYARVDNCRANCTITVVAFLGTPPTGLD